jgi:hypothetical protein
MADPAPGMWAWRTAVALPDVLFFPQRADAWTVGVWDARAAPAPAPSAAAPAATPTPGGGGASLSTFITMTPDLLRQLVDVAQPESGLWEGAAPPAASPPTAPAARMAAHLDAVFRRLAEERKLLFFSRDGRYEDALLLVFHTGLHSRAWEPCMLLATRAHTHALAHAHAHAHAHAPPGPAPWTAAGACTVADLVSPAWWALQAANLPGVAERPFLLAALPLTGGGAAVPRAPDVSTGAGALFGAIAPAALAFHPSVPVRVTERDVDALLERSCAATEGGGGGGAAVVAAFAVLPRRTLLVALSWA